jgi:hypothetical protein
MIKQVKKYLGRKKYAGILIEIIGVILIWRGVWGVLDIYLFPNNPLVNYLVCIIIGFILIWFDDKKLDELK